MKTTILKKSKLKAEITKNKHLLKTKEATAASIGVNLKINVLEMLFEEKYKKMGGKSFFGDLEKPLINILI